jgi:hypothetical protein
MHKAHTSLFYEIPRSTLPKKFWRAQARQETNDQKMLGNKNCLPKNLFHSGHKKPKTTCFPRLPSHQPQCLLLVCKVLAISSIYLTPSTDGTSSFDHQVLKRLVGFIFDLLSIATMPRHHDME